MDTILATAVAAHLTKESFSLKDFQSLSSSTEKPMDMDYAAFDKDEQVGSTVSPTGVPMKVMRRSSIWGNNTSNLIGLVLGGLAAFLSWRCNSSLGYPVYLKLLMAFFAFMFGGIYMLYYVLFRFDVCRAARK